MARAERGVLLPNLAGLLATRFHRRGNVNDLNEAIAYHGEALNLCPAGHSNRHLSLINTAGALLLRFESQGSPTDLDKAIVLLEEVLLLLPVHDLDRYIASNNIAIALSERFNLRGNDNDLNEAIDIHRESLNRLPEGHPSRSMILNNMGNDLVTHFRQRGNDQDLDEAIALHTEAVKSRPFADPDRRRSLVSLAKTLSERFEFRGHDKDLDDSIAHLRESVHLHAVGHQDYPKVLNNMASRLFRRFTHRKNKIDLDEAIALYRKVVSMLPVNHQDRHLSLTGIGTALSVRFNHQDDHKDIDEAVAFHREALTSCPIGHPRRYRPLDALATSLSERWKYQKYDEDLEETIALRMEAITLLPNGHPYRHWYLHNLASSLLERFEHRGDNEDLDKALANSYSALSLLTSRSPDYAMVNMTLGDIHLLLHQMHLDGTANDIDDLNTAMNHIKRAACSVSGGLLFRLQASTRWIRAAEQYMHSSTLEAYANSISLLDAYMSATALVSARHRISKEFATLAVQAASCAVQRDEVCHAVELLEHGRTLIWTQMARFRMPLDTLQERDTHAEAVVKRFRELSSILDRHGAEPPQETTRVREEAEVMLYSRRLDEWKNTVEEIRKFKGFSRFMLPPLFSDLQDAARYGPIVILIPSDSWCNAIIIPHQQSPVSVRLISNCSDIVRMVNTLQKIVERESGLEKHIQLVKVLREVWTGVVCPVVDNLTRFTQPHSRIWWCPTWIFHFLPLHAAGEYRKGGRNFSHLYVSSYTPSLTALLKTRGSYDKSPSVSFAAIGQNRPMGCRFTLECVEPELEVVQRLLPSVSTISFTKVTSADSTRSRTMDTLRNNQWLHFSCHGKQNYSEPFKSAFLMRDKPLTLHDIAETDLSRHEFAFLSACQTAVGAPETPDDVIHLAAGLQFAGVKSVVGTLWKVEDNTVLRFVEAFYKYFCEGGEMDSRRAAHALHSAVRSLANDKGIALDQRIVFMHIGL